MGKGGKTPGNISPLGCLFDDETGILLRSSELETNLTATGTATVTDKSVRKRRNLMRGALALTRGPWFLTSSLHPVLRGHPWDCGSTFAWI